MIDSIVTSLFTIVFKAVLTVLTFIFVPLDALVSTYLPVLDNMLTTVSNYLSYIFTYMGWVISLSGISSTAIAIVISYYIFVLTVPVPIWLIKLGIDWYHHLKPT